MYASGFSRLFWGMLFVIFNINLGQFNILPNFIGYMLFYSGLNILSEKHEIFAKGKIVSAILALLTIKDIINFQGNTLLIGQLGAGGFALMIVDSIISVLNLFLIYIVCRGIYLICEERELDDLKAGASDAWKFYLVLSIIMMFYIPFSINLPRYVNSYAAFGMIIYIIASLWIAMLFRRAGALLEDEEQT